MFVSVVAHKTPAQSVEFAQSVLYTMALNALQGTYGSTLLSSFQDLIFEIHACSYIPTIYTFIEWNT